MKRNPTIESWLPGLLAVCMFVGTVGAKENDAITRARGILDTTGVQGGIVVHLGCGNGKLTAALRGSSRYTVHGFEADPAKVAEARNYIQAQGMYGAVSVEQHSGSVLPYSDNLINLIVVQSAGGRLAADAGNVPMDELMRVLAPGGVACVKRKGKWEKVVKARPDNIDQWTHFLHDASNNAVANDSVVGPPQSCLLYTSPSPRDRS